MRWLITHLPHAPVPGSRSLRTATLRLTDPAGPGPALQAAWQHRRDALARYRDRVAVERDPALVLPSLLHLHHIRMFGVDPERERLGRHLARAAALQWSATPGSQPPGSAIPGSPTPTTPGPVTTGRS